MLAGWLVSAWQISLGFTLGLQYSYLLAALLALVLIALRGRELGLLGGPRAHSRARRRAGSLIPRHCIAVTLAECSSSARSATYEARPYLKISHDYPTAKRTIREVKNYSAGPAALAVGLLGEPRLGRRHPGMRAQVHSKNESVCSPAA